AIRGDRARTGAGARADQRGGALAKRSCPRKRLQRRRRLRRVGAAIATAVHLREIPVRTRGRRGRWRQQRRRMMQRKTMLGSVVALALACLAPVAHGATVSASLATEASTNASLFTLSGDMPGSKLVQGSSATVTTIKVSEAGTLWFTLTDKNFS